MDHTGDVDDSKPNALKIAGASDNRKLGKSSYGVVANNVQGVSGIRTAACYLIPQSPKFTKVGRFHFNSGRMFVLRFKAVSTGHTRLQFGTAGTPDSF